MPITKSAKKALRVSETKRAANHKKEIALDKALKNVSAKTVNETVSLIDKAAKTHLIHPNKAARMKSKLAKQFGTPKAEKKAEAPAAKKTATKSVAKKTEKPAVEKKTAKKETKK